MTMINLNSFDEQTLQMIAHNMEIPCDIEKIDAYVATFQADVLPRSVGFGHRDYWKALKVEIHVLVCGPKDGEADNYEHLRKAIDKHGTKSQLAVISSIAVFVGAKINVEAGILVPWVAMLLGVVRKVGTEAFCRAIEEQDETK